MLNKIGLLSLFVLFGLLPSIVHSQELSPYFYDVGTPTLTDYYIDPVNGDDDRSGLSRAQSLKTVTAAWNKIPQGSTLTGSGYRLLMLPGTFAAGDLPNYWESRYGTAQFPIILQPADGQGTVRFTGGPNVFDCRYLYFININMTPDPAGDAFHCEKCDHLLLRGVTLNGAGNGTRAAQETLKVNQSQYVYVENSNISGASDNAIDFVSVQYGHVVGNRIHNSEDWCMYTKGGSAYLRVEGNEFFNCGTGGYTAGQGTGFEFMESPWTHYEAYDIKFINNVIHDTEGAGVGVNGGYNILIAHNTIYHVGSRSHSIEVVYGFRSCDGNATRCELLRSQGGWGVGSVGTEAIIPNLNVSILNNILYNPMPFRSPDQIFAIYGPRATAGTTNVQSPASTDTNLKIRGNIIWNGPGILPLGVEESDQGCQPANQSCNPTLLSTENLINVLEPQFSSVSTNDFRPLAGGNLSSSSSVDLSSFAGGDRQSTPLAPVGNLVNALDRDRGGSARSSVSLAGAYASSSSSLAAPVPGDDFPSVPVDPGSGGGGGSSGSDPSIGTPTITAKKDGSSFMLTISKVMVSDDGSVARVMVSATPKGAKKSTGFNLKPTKVAGRYTGKKKIKGKSPVSVQIIAVDNEGRMSTRTKKVKIK